MKIMLASSFNNTVKNKNGKKIAVRLSDKNTFLKTIRDNIANRKTMVLVANNPAAIKINDYYFDLMIKSLKLSGLVFLRKMSYWMIAIKR